MTIKQLSVFLENKIGSLNDLLAVLADNNINIIALTVADTSDYGIVRLIVSDPQLALQKLKNKDFSVKIHDVLSFEIKSTTSSFTDILSLFASKNINIEYLYAFNFGTKSIMVVRTNNREKAVEVIVENDLTAITEEDLK